MRRLDLAIPELQNSNRVGREAPKRETEREREWPGQENKSKNELIPLLMMISRRIPSTYSRVCKICTDSYMLI